MVDPAVHHSQLLTIAGSKYRGLMNCWIYHKEQAWNVKLVDFQVVNGFDAELVPCVHC